MKVVKKKFEIVRKKNPVKITFLSGGKPISVVQKDNLLSRHFNASKRISMRFIVRVFDTGAVLKLMSTNVPDPRLFNGILQ